jgi:hypothetical protein
MIFPPALYLLAQLYHENGCMEDKERVLGILESLYQQTSNPIFLLNLALLFLNTGERDRADQLLEQIDWEQLPEDLRKEMLARFAELETELLIQSSMESIVDLMREKIEEKNMPIEWIDAAVWARRPASPPIRIWLLFCSPSNFRDWNPLLACLPWGHPLWRM